MPHELTGYFLFVYFLLLFYPFRGSCNKLSQEQKVGHYEDNIAGPSLYQSEMLSDIFAVGTNTSTPTGSLIHKN